MMKHFCVIVLCLGIATVYGQDYPMPAISKTGTALNDFAPDGWTMKDLASGDLNKDSLVDHAFVLLRDDSLRCKDREGFDMKILPRILVIVFKTQQGSLILKEANKSMLVNTNFPPTYADPFQSISIKNGVLIVDFFYDFINGNFYGYSYKFRYSANHFFLVGADIKYSTRRTMDYEKSSYNFLTKKWSLTKGVHDHDVTPTKVKETIEWFDLKRKALKVLSNFGPPTTMQISED